MCYGEQSAQRDSRDLKKERKREEEKSMHEAGALENWHLIWHWTYFIIISKKKH